MSSGRLRARRSAVAAATALLALVPLAAPAAARAGVGSAVVGGPALAGRGVIVHYPAHGARRLPSVHASSYVIADAGSGQVLAAKDPHGHFLPASTLKICGKLDPAGMNARASICGPSRVSAISGLLSQR